MRPSSHCRQDRRGSGPIEWMHGILRQSLLALLAFAWHQENAEPASAQSRVRLPGDVPPSLTVNGTALPGWAPVPNSVTGGVNLGNQIQPFDPYAAQIPSYTPLGGVPNGSPYGPVPGPAGYPPPAAPWNLPPPSLPPLSTPPATAPGWPGGPTIPPANLPPTLPPTYNPVTPGYGTPGYGTPPYGTAPPQPYPTLPSVTPPVPTPVFPNGLGWGQPERLFQDTGAAYTYLYGNEGEELQVNEIEIFTTLVLKYFANNTSGFRLTPGFVFDFLDGPRGTAADLPAQLYSAYLDASWRPQFTPQFSGDLSVRTGVYSDFDTITWHSIRFTGRGLGVVQLTPTLAMKLGVEYLDRVKIKLLPAGGFVWEPDSETRWDIYFPRPMFSKYWKTVGNTDFWWHIGAEYGGSSWTIDRLDAPLLDMSERIDLNDIRVFTGIDWDRLNGFDGLFQIGYAFDREIVFKEVPAETTELDDTFMVRLGLQF